MTCDVNWHPIETAPKNGTAVLLFHPEWDTMEVGLQYDETGMWQQPNGDLLATPTHWLALPETPDHRPSKIRAG